MKVLKKFAGMILAVCLMVPMIGTVAFAAEGVLMFSDPSAKVGDNVDVDLVVQSNSGETVGNVEVNMTYDPTALEFVSGEGFTADGSGALTFTGTGDGAELRETMTFRALTTGEAKITAPQLLWQVTRHWNSGRGHLQLRSLLRTTERLR